MAKQEKSAAEAYRQERKERLAKAAKKNQKKSHNVVLSKKSKTLIAVVLVIALVAGIAGFSVSNSGILERGKVAFTVGDAEVSMAEYSYYYNSVFSNYFNYSYQYDYYYGEGMGVMYTGYDYATAPDAQAYGEEIEGIENPTFADFFDHSAKESIKHVKASLNYAAENGIELDEDDLKKVEETVQSVEDGAKEQNYSLAAYLRAYYGKAMSVDALEKICYEQAVASKVQETKTEEYTSSYSDKKIDKEYNDNLLTYGTVSLRNYVVNAEKVTEEAETEGAEATSKVTKETMAAAKEKAESFEKELKSGKAFTAVAADFEKEAGNADYKAMKTDDSLTLIKDAAYGQLNSTDEDFLDWAMSKDTEKGEVFITEEADTGYTVYMMEEPVHHAPDTLTYDVRHILIQFPEEEEAEETEEAAESEEAAEETTEKAEEKKDEVEVELLNAADYDVTVDIDVDLDATKDKELYKQAQDILSDYLAGDKTEDSFAALAVEHSADGNAADGGIYEDVALGDMVPEFENWAVAEGRKPGDVGIVETSYGYHIMYSVAVNTTTWQDTIKNDLATEEYNTFSQELTASVSVDNILQENVDAVKDFVISLAKTQIRNIQANAAAAQ